MTEPNDIPAILARVKHWTPRPKADTDIQVGPGEGCHFCRDDYGEHEASCIRPIEARDAANMAAEILSLRAQVEQMKPDFASSFMRLHQSDDELLAKKRLDVLEELREQGNLAVEYTGGVILHMISHFPTLTEAADAALSRREKENG